MTDTDKYLRENVHGKTFPALTQWPHNDKVRRGYRPSDVQEYCVRDKFWQQLRLSMKGQTTADKLSALVDWFDLHADIQGNIPYSCEVQIGNYLGALRRGGQLDEHNKVKRDR